MSASNTRRSATEKADDLNGSVSSQIQRTRYRSALRKSRARVTCHNCETEAKRHGFFNGIHRYRCRTCGKTFADIPIRPLDSLRVPREKALQVLNLIETFGSKLKRFHDQTVVNVSVENIQIDEI